MPLDLARLLAPGGCALITQECQRGVIGDRSALPELAANAQSGMIDAVAGLVDAAHAAGVQVIHCLAERRLDGRGANHNARLFQYMGRSEFALLQGTDAARLVPEIPLDGRDIVLRRLHGLSPFQGTELDSILRNLGINTIVAVGVSVNVAIQNLAFDAVNAAYQVVIARDAVAGFPLDYVEQVFEHTLGGITTVLAAAQIREAWQQASS
jgi:nicotinamidase-related amidase